MDTRLLDTANKILDYLVTALPAQGIAIPDRRYIHAGIPAQDLVGKNCADALIVSYLAGFQGQIGGSGGDVPEAAIRCAMPTSWQFVICLYRCVPTFGPGIRPPTVNQLNDSAEEILADAMTLARVIIHGTLAGTLRNDHMDLVGIGNVSAIGPNGGLGGTEVSMFVSIL